MSSREWSLFCALYDSSVYVDHLQFYKLASCKIEWDSSLNVDHSQLHKSVSCEIECMIEESIIKCCVVFKGYKWHNSDGHYYCDRNLNLLFEVSPSRIVETYLHGSENIIIKMWPSYMESKMMVECPCWVIWVPCIASIVIRWSRGKLFEVDKFLLFWNIKGIDWFAGKKLKVLFSIKIEGFIWNIRIDSSTTTIWFNAKVNIIMNFTSAIWILLHFKVNDFLLNMILKFRKFYGQKWNLGFFTSLSILSYMNQSIFNSNNN